MSVALKIAGQKFNRLTATKRVGTTKDNKAIWLFECDCGRATLVTAKEVKRGHVKSCGCLQREAVVRLNVKRKTHGMKGTPEYQAWASMKNRCTNPKDKVFEDYGSRGITVCDRWMESFENFIIDMGPRPIGTTFGGKPEYSLDRINNDGNYEPGNCRWATRKQQTNNRRRFRAIEKFSIAELQAALSKKLKGAA
jgi:hypothetical protein